MPAIQVVLFDLGGTLLHYEQPPERSFDAIGQEAMRAFLGAAAAAGGNVGDATMIVQAVMRTAAAMEAKARHLHAASTAEEIIREGLEAVRVKLSREAWEAGIAAYYRCIAEGVTLVSDDVPEVLATLVAQGRNLGLVSNTSWSPEIHDSDLERFGLAEYLPVRIYSSQFGVVKPHPTIYRAALDALNVAPSEAVFVGDRLSVDVAGPKKIGMRAILMDSPYRSEEQADAVPDARLARLAELPALLLEWDEAIESLSPPAAEDAAEF
jgi:putative hydrolase of the HAD superfamily